jgi:predicted transcriptional regulator
LPGKCAIGVGGSEAAVPVAGRVIPMARDRSSIDTGGMSRLGSLERAVMETLWSAGQPLSARQVHDALPTPDLALTTVLTVLHRLGGKGLVDRERHGRAHLYQAVATREDHIAELMRDSLGSTAERGAALARFVGSIPVADREPLRALLHTGPDRPAPPGAPP